MVATLLLAIILTGCQSGKMGIGKTIDDMVIRHGGGFNTYATIKHDFDYGHIMRARARALAMEQDNRDYVQSRQLLKRKIEPARRRIFLHYLRLAKRYEQQRQWSKAMQAYDQAMAVTIQPAAMQQRREAMWQQLRQLRFQRLIQQRRRQDQLLFRQSRAFIPPAGLSAQDEMYGRMRAHYHDRLDDRARLAFREAKRFLRKGAPEMAYLEIESYLRFRPDSKPGKKLLLEIKQGMPAFVKIPRAMGHGGIENTGIGNVEGKQANIEGMGGADQEVTVAQVQAATKAGNWLQASQLAQRYHHQHGKDAESVLSSVQHQTDAAAKKLFTKGNVAFRQERLNLAIQYWSDTVALVPEKSEYAEALRRARQLKERLRLLQE